ncbi:LysR family transcriptional regulator [Gilvimarinus algae]|uniref:LysR substrate-binding domain-containing protein n=1 Tax=Gilvimarinus algae TaxID=3058037 RepID=A0ABT8TC65_9GAMM|nr:LysR family transcriptional regulator [Gilvimarinus sp. SDUM040014]MDO3381495.1 LysR substrate-binding domain-containing protein [Gilvimarinus sp. SDUM040014]
MSELLHQQLPNVYVFHQVARLGSFQAAAEYLNLTRSAVSKKVAQLEQHLNQRLLQRSTRQLRLTEAGQTLLGTTGALEQLLASTARLRHTAQQTPAGTVKISSSTLIGERYLLPLLPALQERYPQVVIDINLDDRVVNLIELGIDIAIRVGQLPDSSLVARKVGEKSWGCYASPAYIERRGEPAVPAELSEHQCLVFRHQQLCMDHWSFAQEGAITSVKVTPAMATDDGRTLIAMAGLGMGIVRVDPLLIQPELASGTLVPILSRWQHPDRSPIHLVCLGREARSPAVEAVWQYLAQHLSQTMTTAKE